MHIPKVDVLFGGQYGSEGKGVIAAAMASDYDVHVRVGAPNAGHSFIGPDRKLWKMQTVPVGWCNPQALLIIGRGGLIAPELLRREVEAIADVDPSIYGRLYIDAKCGVLDERFHQQEGGVNGEMHARIGSTGEGVGPAREARISRDPERFRLYRDLADEDVWFAQFEAVDTPRVINTARQSGGKILLEGAQGQGLSLIHGPWPYCTSTDPGPAQLAADVGVPVTALGRIIACMRTYPIRVAGNSGPLNNEIDFNVLSEKLGRPVLEHTTVTGKVRRIAEWDMELAKTCCMLHGPNEIALTFLDYVNPDDEGVDDWTKLSEQSQNYVRHIEDKLRVPITFVGTGGPKLRVLKRYQP